MLKKILPAVKGYWIPTIITPLLMIGEVVMECLIPLTMGEIIDKGIYGNNINFVILNGLKMIGFAMLSLAFGCIAARTGAVAGTGFAKNLRKILFNKIQSFSFKNIDTFSTGSLITRLTNDVTNVQMTFVQCVKMLFRAPITFIVAIFMAIKLSPQLSLSFTIFVPIIAIALGVIMKLAFGRFGFMLKTIDNLNTNIQENLIAIRTVKAFVRGDFEKKKFADSAANVRTAQITAEKIVIWNGPVMQFCMYSCIILVSWLGAKLVIGGGMGTGQLMSFFTYITQILMSLMMVSMLVLMLTLSVASIRRINEVLNTEPDIADGKRSDIVPNGDISFRNVKFSYTGNIENPTLNNINLEIKSGQTIGIIGGTGSAKSTLVQLIPRLYDATEGEVLVGGNNVKDYSLEALRDAVSMVLQNNVLFSGSIIENLRWGNSDATEEEIIEACKAAQAHDFIMSFPDGYQTDLGQGGVNVSGGQKQRLCIARALLKNPKVLILDDSTSACDTATDSKIRAGLKNAHTDCTKIIIAQRITSIMDSDMIIVLDDGEVKAVGNHEELMSSSEIYREVYTSQQKGAE